MLLAAYQVGPDTADRNVPISDNNWLDAFRVPFGDWIKMTSDWVNSEAEWVTDTIKWPFETLFNFIMNENPARDSIMSISWIWMVIVMFLLGSFMRNTRIGLMVAGMTALCGFLGQEYWEQVSKTFGMIIISVALCVIVGIPLGVLCGRFDGVWNVTRPVLDAMQVIHSFVWMLPFIAFFGIGNVSATMVTMIYALPPLVRLTNLGVRQVPEDVVEASRSFGANELRVLTDVQLPLARPAIMTGFNQTLLLAFSMLGIAAYIGADGLGKLIFRAINNVNIALGAGAGLTFFLTAVILDRISQPEADDGLSLLARIRQAFAYGRDAEGTYLQLNGPGGSAEIIESAPVEPEITEYPEPITASERMGLMLAAGGSAVAIIAAFLTWSSDAGKISSWGRFADESLPGQSFNGLAASGGSFFGIFVLFLSVLALAAAVRPLVTIGDGISRTLNKLQGYGLVALAALVVLNFVLNLVGVGLVTTQMIALLVMLAIVLLIAVDTFVRGTPRLAADGALIAAVGALGVALAFVIAQPHPSVVDVSTGIGAYLAVIGAGVASVGALMAVFRAPYAARVPISTSFPLGMVITAAIGGGLLFLGAIAAWIVDERTGADAANRIFVKGLQGSGPLLGWPVLIFGAVAIVVTLMLAVTRPVESNRWRLGAIIAAPASAIFFLSMAFTLSISRNGDTDYLNDRNALTGAGILLAITGAGVFFAIARGIMNDFRRKKVYLSVASSPAAADEPEVSEAELVGAAR